MKTSVNNFIRRVPEQDVLISKEGCKPWQRKWALGKETIACNKRPDKSGGRK